MLRVSNLNLKSVFLVGFDLIMLFNSHKKQKGVCVFISFHRKGFS